MKSASLSKTTIQDALRDAERLLMPVHETARIDAEVLLAYGINRNRAHLHSRPDEILSTEQLDRFTSLIRRRATGEPVAYLTGIREFWSMPLTVTNKTLIPRPETELLVEHALSRIETDAAMRVADLGTGCGAIALAIASERPLSHVVASDVDGQALNIARINAQQHNISNVEFRQGNWFAPMRGERFHVITSNPPYIGEHDPHIRQGDLRFEPQGALIAGKDGLEAIINIVSGAKPYLLDAGWLIIEHGYKQQSRILELFAHEGYQHMQGKSDHAGHGRLVMGQLVST